MNVCTTVTDPRYLDSSPDSSVFQLQLHLLRVREESLWIRELPLESCTSNCDPCRPNLPPLFDICRYGNTMSAWLVPRLPLTSSTPSPSRNGGRLLNCSRGGAVWPLGRSYWFSVCDSPASRNTWACCERSAWFR